MSIELMLLLSEHRPELTFKQIYEFAKDTIDSLNEIPVEKPLVASRFNLCSWLDDKLGLNFVNEFPNTSTHRLSHEFDIDSSDAEDAVNWYLQHPDHINW